MTSNPGLFWIIRLRWVALPAQSATIAIAAFTNQVSLRLPFLLAGLAVTAITNLAAHFGRSWLQPRALGWCGALLALDTVTLTVLLHGSGGAGNPFTTFYLLHITLAALLLPQRLTLWTIATASIGFTTLHLGAPSAAIPSELQAPGQLAALGLTGVCLAYFVGRMQDSLRDSQLRLVRQERFAGLATLAAGVAHELATPLGTIAVVSRELERTACTQCLNHSCRDDARLIRSETDRCRLIIDRLNADSTTGVGDAPESVGLAHLAAELTPLLSAPHAARLRFQPPTRRNSQLVVSRQALLQSLAVLVKNACEADEAGRPVLLRIEDRDLAVTFSVEDSGPGLAPEATARLGEPFFTTKPPGQGMGLGLYIARMFAERLHGSLELHALPAGGTAARLTLPHPALVACTT